MFKSKYLQASSLAGYGIILSVLNQVIDINEFGAIGEAMTNEAASGGGTAAILIGGALAGLAAIFRDEKK